MKVVLRVIVESGVVLHARDEDMAPRLYRLVKQAVRSEVERRGGESTGSDIRVLISPDDQPCEDQP